MSIDADRWGSHPKHFWLREREPEPMVELDEQTGMWNVYGCPEALQIISDATTFKSDMTHLFPDMDKSMNDGNMIQLDDPANRDKRQFADPHEFNPARDPNPHLGFGRGVHFCIGAPLARLEGRVALNLLLDRFPVLRTDPDDAPRMMPTTDMTGVKTLPLRTS